MPIPKQYYTLVATSIILLILCAPALFALDTQKYIPFDEIEPGMDAYCLTVYQGTDIEKFPLEIIGTIYKFRPGQNRIIVKGTDPRFEKTGPVQGCSGSPVYIEGRIAGALSSGYSFAKDALYLATPIEEMLNILESPQPTKQNAQSATAPRLAIDFSKPLDFQALKKQYSQLINTPPEPQNNTLCPILSSLPADAIQNLQPAFRSAGFNLLQNASTSPANNQTPDLSQIKPGGVLAIPLMDGDISLAATGTITDVIPSPAGDTILAFGHGFNSQGPVEMPIALGKVHTVIANTAISFKLSSTTTPIGTLIQDQQSGVVGIVGKTPKTIDFNLTIDNYADSKIRHYNNRLAVHRRYTPLLLRAAIMGATMKSAEPPYEHTFQYAIDYEFENHPPLHFENISSQMGFAQILDETGLVMILLLNNPYEPVKVNKINVDIKIVPKSSVAEFNRIAIKKTTANPGQTITINALLDTIRGDKINKTFNFTIPSDTTPGTYQLSIGGPFTYENIYTQNKRHLLTAYDVPSLLESLRLYSTIKRDKVYITMNTPSGGVALREKQLPKLPATKSLLLSDPKHTDVAQPYSDWIEKIVPVDFILMDEHQFSIKIENKQK